MSRVSRALGRALDSTSAAMASLVLLVGLIWIEAAGSWTPSAAQVTDINDRLAGADLVPGCRDLVMRWPASPVRLVQPIGEVMV